MIRKHNLNFIPVIMVSIFLTVFLTTIVSYQIFKKEIFSDLSSVAENLEKLNILEGLRTEGILSPGDALRLTWVSEDGSVLYDSYAGETGLDNHGDRPEIIQAFREGEGSCIRKSQTMEQSIFFYAKRTDDGKVIRIAKHLEGVPEHPACHPADRPCADGCSYVLHREDPVTA